MTDLNNAEARPTRCRVAPLQEALYDITEFAENEMAHLPSECRCSTPQRKTTKGPPGPSGLWRLRPSVSAGLKPRVQKHFAGGRAGLWIKAQHGQ
jgi:hypothetical protein